MVGMGMMTLLRRDAARRIVYRPGMRSAPYLLRYGTTPFGVRRNRKSYGGGTMPHCADGPLATDTSALLGVGMMNRPQLR